MDLAGSLLNSLYSKIISISSLDCCILCFGHIVPEMLSSLETPAKKPLSSGS